MDADEQKVFAARRGATQPSLVPEEVLARLASGAPSVNHMEEMALDMGQLLVTQFPALAAEASRLGAVRFLDRMRAGAAVLFEHFGAAAPEVGRASSSDTVRGWGAFATALVTQDVGPRVELLLPFAADAHFAVREWAWLALRDLAVAHPLIALQHLRPVAQRDDPLLRRFAVEALRPKGVWSQHIALFKNEPGHATALLDGVAPTASRYVQDSVANWVNDVSRVHPEWATSTVDKWRQDHGAAVKRLAGRALRSLPEPVHRPPDRAHELSRSTEVAVNDIEITPTRSRRPPPSAEAPVGDR